MTERGRGQKAQLEDKRLICLDIPFPPNSALPPMINATWHSESSSKWAEGLGPWACGENCRSSASRDASAPYSQASGPEPEHCWLGGLWD